MLVIVFRGATGLTLYNRVQSSPRDYQWICSRNDLSVGNPTGPEDSRAVLGTLGSHSTTHGGAIQQVVQLDL